MKRIQKNILLSLLALTTLGSSFLYADYDESAEEKAVYAKELREAKVKTKRQKVKKAPKEKDAGWYMRTRVSATTDDGTVYTHNTAGVFGKLKQSKNKKDRHDISSYAPATLQVVFPHYNWNEGEAGDYWSDYRRYNKRKTNKRVVYTFQVKNQGNVDLSNADIEIKLDDAIDINYVKENGNVRYIEKGTNPEIKQKFTLVDVDNERTYSVDELEYANLNMDGNHTRTFRWVRGRVKKKDFKPVVLPN